MVLVTQTLVGVYRVVKDFRKVNEMARKDMYQRIVNIQGYLDIL